MLVEEKKTAEVLRQIVCKVTNDRALHDDLVQEAFIHLWMREQQHPGQRRSWYLQSCRLFLQNFLRHGRSVDSVKHRRVTSLQPETDDILVEVPDESASVLARVSAREILILLESWLTPLERQILDCLAEGFAIRQIAARFNVSHTSILRHRRAIACLALKLGIDPLRINEEARHSRDDAAD